MTNHTAPTWRLVRVETSDQTRSPTTSTRPRLPFIDDSSDFHAGPQLDVFLWVAGILCDTTAVFEIQCQHVAAPQLGSTTFGYLTSMAQYLLSEAPAILGVGLSGLYIATVSQNTLDRRSARLSRGTASAIPLTSGTRVAAAALTPLPESHEVPSVSTVSRSINHLMICDPKALGDPCQGRYETASPYLVSPPMIPAASDPFISIRYPASGFPFAI